MRELPRPHHWGQAREPWLLALEWRKHSRGWGTPRCLLILPSGGGSQWGHKSLIAQSLTIAHKETEAWNSCGLPRLTW